MGFLSHWVCINEVPFLMFACLCLLWCQFIAALRSHVGKGLVSWLLNVCDASWAFLVLLSLSHMGSWVRCCTSLYWFLIFAFSLTFIIYWGNIRPITLTIMKFTSIINETRKFCWFDSYSQNVFLLPRSNSKDISVMNAIPKTKLLWFSCILRPGQSVWFSFPKA